MKVTSAVLVFVLFSCQAFSSSQVPFYQNGSGLDGALYEKIKTIELFSTLNKTDVGSPFYLNVYFVNKATSGGAAAAATSGLLALTSLGIIPIVSNEDKTLRYEIWLNMLSYATYEFTKNFSSVEHLWAMDHTQKMDPRVLEWALTTVDELGVKVYEDPKIKQMLDDYEFYFADRN